MTNREKTVILNAIENSLICLSYADEDPDDCEFYIRTAIDWLDDVAHFVKNARCKDISQCVKIDTSGLPGIPDDRKSCFDIDDDFDNA